MNNSYKAEYKKGEILFFEGGKNGISMYNVLQGKVGIYKDYDKPTQTLLAEITEGFFGELGLVANVDRTATAVILEDSFLEIITINELDDYIKANPLTNEIMLRTLSSRLRYMNSEYMQVCRTVSEYKKAEELGEKPSKELVKRMKKFASHV